MKTAERIVMLAILGTLGGGGVWGYLAVTGERADFRERVAAGEFEMYDEEEVVSVNASDSEVEWRRYYPVTHPIRIGDVRVEASIADTLSKRIKGLSDTPYLPTGVIKLFAFGVPGKHTIWMKDMNYTIDILWADQDGTIVHIVEGASPDSYDARNPEDSETFSSPVDTWFVVETNAGFVAEHGIKVGQVVMIPRQ